MLTIKFTHDKMYLTNKRKEGKEMNLYELSNGVTVSERVVGKLEKGSYITYEQLANMVENMVLSNSIFSNAEIDCVEFYDDDHAEVLLENHIEQYRNDYGDDDYDDYDIYEYKINTINESFQFYIVDKESAETLVKFNEVVLYHNELDLAVWCVGHCGASWEYVNTDIGVESVR